MKIFFLTVALLGALAGAVIAAETLDVLVLSDGVKYRDVRWGPVNQGKVVVFHNRGVAYVPLEKLPADLQARFGYNPSAAPATPAAPQPVTPVAPSAVVASVAPEPAPRPSLQEQLEAMHNRSSGTASSGNSEWREYVHQRASLVLLDGKLVERSMLTPLTGFVIRITTENGQLQGTTLELAEKRADAKTVSAALELRPGLWRGTGQQVMLRNYDAEVPTGDVIRVFVQETNPLGDTRAFLVAKEPTFEQWQRLRRH